MFRKYLLPPTALAALLLVLISFTRADDPPQQPPTRLPLTPRDIKESLGTHWYGVYFHDKKTGTKKIGYFRSTLAREGDGDKGRLVESSEMSMKLMSLGRKGEMKQSQRVEFEARPPYKIVRAEYQSNADTTQTILCVAKGDGLEVTITTGGQARTRKIPAFDYTLADSLTTDVWVRQKPKVGDTITVRELDLEDLKTSLVTNKMLATKASLIAGVKVVYHELDCLMHKLNLTSRTRCDARGRMLSSKLGDQFELRREPEELAKNTEYSTDVFVLGMVKIDAGVGEPTRVTGLVVEIPDKEGTFLKSASRQTVTTGPNGNVLCKLGKGFATPVKATEKEIAEALEETTAYPISLPRVQELARKAVGDAQTPREKVRRLAKFVHDYIRPSLETSVPKLEHLLDRKAGDCKSYALLFNTLARAAGIPTRELGGLLYMGDAVKAFGGHAWNEVVLDGNWVPIDASLNETEINAAHVSFGSERESVRNLLDSLGRLSFRLVEVQRTP
jgi:hypothetical protein